MSSPKILSSLDWWYSPFAFGGWHAPCDDERVINPMGLVDYRDLNSELFQSSSATRFRGRECIDSSGLEHLLWHFDFRLDPCQWVEIFRMLWVSHSASNEETLISCLREMIEILVSQSVNFGISGVYPHGLHVDVPEQSKDKELCRIVALAFRPLYQGKVSDHDFVREHMNRPSCSEWDFDGISLYL